MLGQTATFYSRFHKRIFDFLYKHTHDAGIALELMQDTFLNFHSSFQKVPMVEDRALVLLYTISRNLSINYAKKIRNKKSTAILSDEATPKDKSQEPMFSLQDLEYRMNICLSELKEEERSAILLRNIEGYGLQKIADILDVNVATASKLIIRAQERLVKMAKARNLVPE